MTRQKNNPKKAVVENGVLTVPDGVHRLTERMVERLLDVHDDCYIDHRIIEVRLPDGLQTIGARAFSYFKKLEKINIPDSVESIERDAFHDCESLRHIDLPKKLKVIGDSAFCFSGLIEVRLPDQLQIIGDEAFSGCGLVEVRIPKSVRSIGAYAFNCRDLKRMIVESDLWFDATSVGVHAELEIRNPNSPYMFKDGLLMTKDGKEVVLSQPSLKEVVLPETCEVVGSHAFEDRKITHIDLSNIREIKDWGISGHNKFEQIHLPKSLRKIGRWAFANCRTLKQLRISCPAVINSEHVRWSPIKKVIVEDGAPYVCEKGMWMTKDRKRLIGCLRGKVELTIPDGVQRIDDYVFLWRSRLKRVILPKTLKRLGKGAFSYCRSLERIDLPVGLKEIPAEVFEGCWNLESVNIPDGVTRIGRGAFWSCGKLRSITIPASVKNVARDAFDRHGHLKEVHVAKGNKIKDIERYFPEGAKILRDA